MYKKQKKNIDAECSGTDDVSISKENSANTIKHRPLLIVFKTGDEAQVLIRNKDSVNKNVAIKLGRTEYQRKKLIEAYNEKKQKEENNEDEFKIKLINDTPKFVPKTTIKK